MKAIYQFGSLLFALLLSTTSFAHLEMNSLGSLWQHWVSKNPFSNYVASNPSIYGALALLALGAEPESKTEHELKAALSIEELSSMMTIYPMWTHTLSIKPVDSNPMIKVATQIFMAQQFKIDPAFTSKAQRMGITPQQLDFSKPDAVTHINGWMAQNTNNLIRTIVNDIKPDDRAILVNALLFQASWASAFEKSRTQKTTFKGLKNDGISSLKEVDMMEDESNYFYDKSNKGEIVRLDFRDTRYMGNFSMYIVLPAQAQPHPALSAEQLTAWIRKMERQYGQVKLPKFKFSSTYDLGDGLKEIGVRQIFIPRQAGLKRIGTDDRFGEIYVSRLLHSASISVNEEGVEAAAGTAILGAVAACPLESPQRAFTMTMDRPFQFFIRDNRDGTILFQGILNSV